MSYFLLLAINGLVIGLIYALTAAGLTLVFAWPIALLIGLAHLLIDTRQPLNWWLRMVKQMPSAPNHGSVEIWVDQVMHVTVLAIVALAINL